MITDQNGKSIGKRLQVVGSSKLAVLGVALAILGGCASMGAGTKEDVVTQRANERWAALIKGDINAAYVYNTPGYRANVSTQKYIEQRGKDVRVLKGEVLKVTCETDDKCVAQVRLTATAPFLLTQKKPSQIVTHVDETWLLENGQWWIFERI